MFFMKKVLKTLDIISKSIDKMTGLKYKMAWK